jgi:xylulokinase
VILTFDLGTTVTKATVWGPEGPVAEGRAEVATDHPQPGWDEQDPASWWESTVTAARRAREADPGAWPQVEAIVFAAARETVALFDATGRALSTGIVWSDRRAPRLPHERGAASGRTLANLAWLASERFESLASARWALGPRDAVVWRLTGEVMTDGTLAARTGCYSPDGAPLDAAPVDLLAPVRPSTHAVGPLTSEAAAALALPAGVTVVLGAGDRACEVLGAGATPDEPMVSWGTTANVSLPVDAVPEALDGRVAVSPGALGGHLVECGLSAAGPPSTGSAASPAVPPGSSTRRPRPSRPEPAACWRRAGSTGRAPRGGTPKPARR